MLVTPLSLYWCSSCCCFNNMFLTPSHSFLLLLQIKGRVGISGVVFSKNNNQVITFFTLGSVVCCVLCAFSGSQTCCSLAVLLVMLMTGDTYFLQTFLLSLPPKRANMCTSPGQHNPDVEVEGISLNFRRGNLAPEWWAQGAGSLTSASMNRLQPGPALGIDEESDYCFAY